MHNCAFQGLKPTFMHVAGLPATCFNKRQIKLKNGFFLRLNMVGKT